MAAIATSPTASRPQRDGQLAVAFKPLDDDAKGKVKQQIEFYFSDSNLPRDKFLRETVEADPDGFVDIALLVTFSRVRALLTPFGGPHNDETVADVTALLETSAELTVSDDKKRIRRTTELRPREEVDAEVEQRSVYASPFPMTATIDELTEFFNKHTKVLSIRLRRHITSKDFKGKGGGC
jgi:lupus La protein